DGRGAGGGDPRAGRGRGRLRRDGGRRDDGGGAGTGARRAPPAGGRGGPVHHGARAEDHRGGERGAPRGSHDRAEAARGGRAGGSERSPMSAAGTGVEAGSAIPSAAGLGSSAAGVVAGAAAAAGLLALDLSDETLAALCVELEGHPDNVAAAIYGGATLVLRGAAGKLAFTPLPVHPSLVLVFAVPDFGVETERARAVLPHVVPHRSAVIAAARSAA